MLAFGSYLNIYIQCIWNETTKFNFSYMSFKLINKFIVFKEHWIPQFSPNASMISFHTIKDVPLKWFPPSWLELALPHSFSYVCIQLVTDSYAHFGDKISICSYNFFLGSFSNCFLYWCFFFLWWDTGEICFHDCWCRLPEGRIRKSCWRSGCYPFWLETLEPS